jgi:hypothetical protein
LVAGFFANSFWLGWWLLVGGEEANHHWNADYKIFHDKILGLKGWI